jgi:hypothetical protein
MKLEPGTAYRLDRRRFFQAAAGTAAAAGATGTLAWPSSSTASDDDLRDVVPPTPIPGGLQFPDVPFIHVFVPGDPSITLPFTGITLQGFDVEPSTFTDRRGFTALAYHVGTAMGSDGKAYDLETDIRAYQGAYVDSTGQRRFGTFAFI